MKRTAQVLHLRIVSNALWQAIKARQETIARPATAPDGTAPFSAKQRPRYLLTGKVFCGTCGSTYGKVGKLRSACHARTNYGAAGCSNDLMIRIGELEQQVLATLQDEMMQPDVVEAFVAEYIAESNRMARRNDSERAERERKEVGAGITRLTAAVLKGVDAALLAEDLNRLGRRKAVLEADLAGPAPETRPALLHPRLAQVYRPK
jgi:site-specific DNA recombinase